MFGKNQSTPTIIDSSARLEGNFSSQADLVVNGRIIGTIETTENIEVKESASLKASLKAKNIIVAGQIEGNIEAIEKLEITKTGRIRGDIKCKVLGIERDAKLSGECSMPMEKGKAVVKEKGFRDSRSNS